MGMLADSALVCLPLPIRDPQRRLADLAVALNSDVRLESRPCQTKIVSRYAMAV